MMVLMYPIEFGMVKNSMTPIKQSILHEEEEQELNQYFWELRPSFECKIIGKWSHQTNVHHGGCYNEKVNTDI